MKLTCIGFLSNGYLPIVLFVLLHFVTCFAFASRFSFYRLCSAKLNFCCTRTYSILPRPHITYSASLLAYYVCICVCHTLFISEITLTFVGNCKSAEAAVMLTTALQFPPPTILAILATQAILAILATPTSGHSWEHLSSFFAAAIDEKTDTCWAYEIVAECLSSEFLYTASSWQES